MKIICINNYKLPYLEVGKIYNISRLYESKVSLLEMKNSFSLNRFETLNHIPLEVYTKNEIINKSIVYCVYENPKLLVNLKQYDHLIVKSENTKLTKGHIYEIINVDNNNLYYLRNILGDKIIKIYLFNLRDFFYKCSNEEFIEYNRKIKIEKIKYKLINNRKCLSL